MGDVVANCDWDLYWYCDVGVWGGVGRRVCMCRCGRLNYSFCARVSCRPILFQGYVGVPQRTESTVCRVTVNYPFWLGIHFFLTFSSVE